MSEVDRVYKEIPLEQRICEGCGNPIYRNLVVLDGHRFFHYGCLKKTKAKPVALCLDCFSYLTGDNVLKSFVDGRPIKSCGECGSTNLKWLRRR